MSKLFSGKPIEAIAFTLLLLSPASGQQRAKNGFDVLDYVNPLIGTSNGGMY
jgi:hypothetical protein